MPRYHHLASSPRRDLRHILRWRVLDTLAGRRTPYVAGQAPPVVPHDPEALAAPVSLTWIGHATFLLRLGGQWVATDPLWSTRIQRVVPRLAPPGVPFDEVPPIDLVTVSHDHFDHLDLATLRRIGPRATYVVPVGCGRILRGAGLPNVVELEWWQTHAHGALTVTLVPSRHWSMRMPWTRNQTLWGGFVIRGPEGAAYHAGDTGFFDGFAEIGERCGPLDWAMLPIGAYDPEWFMRPQHMGPEDAGRAFQALGARLLLPMHWATFRLTDEPLHAPAERLRAFWAAEGLDPARLRLLSIGETLRG